MWRQGDVLIERVETIPANLPKLKRLILASGDSTGQRHQIKERRVQLFNGAGGNLFLSIEIDQATVVHPEHDAIELVRGNYRIWMQREFTDSKPRPVRD